METEEMVQDVVAQALKLPANARFEVMERIQQSLDKPDPEIDRTWAQEALRRARAIDEGREPTWSMEETFKGL